ncbi:hypothetical protein IWW51_003722 [Coemansia sp. RSA 2702]|nr:hypothetical protein IWW51_003722 [Coemansia sp. RSA 2702]
MRAFRFNKLYLLCLLPFAAAANVVDVGAYKDATVVYNTDDCDGTPCAFINHGSDTTLTASVQSASVQRILLAFALPSGINLATAKCQLQMQRPVQAPSGKYTLVVSEALGDWDEEEVNGSDKIDTGNQVGSVSAVKNERPGVVDVTGACRNSKDGQVGLWVDSSGPEVSFPSRDTGAAAQLRIF